MLKTVCDINELVMTMIVTLSLTSVYSYRADCNVSAIVAGEVCLLIGSLSRPEVNKHWKRVKRG